MELFIILMNQQAEITGHLTKDSPMKPKKKMVSMMIEISVKVVKIQEKLNLESQTEICFLFLWKIIKIELRRLAGDFAFSAIGSRLSGNLK